MISNCFFRKTRNLRAEEVLGGARPAGQTQLMFFKCSTRPNLFDH